MTQQQRVELLAAPLPPAFTCTLHSPMPFISLSILPEPHRAQTGGKAAHVSQTSSHIQELHYLAGLNKSRQTDGTKMKGRRNHVRNSCWEICLHTQCVMQVYIMEM